MSAFGRQLHLQSESRVDLEALAQMQQRSAVPKVAGGAERANEVEKPGAKGGWGGQSGRNSQNGRIARCWNDECRQSGCHVRNGNPMRELEAESNEAGDDKFRKFRIWGSCLHGQPTGCIGATSVI